MNRRTAFQENNPLRDTFHLSADLVLVYGIDATLPSRIRMWQDAGYETFAMTGLAWGEYPDFLEGDFDGEAHKADGQLERDGRSVIHGPNVPYLVPTDALASYLVSRLCPAVDAGASGIVLEEPEFWDRSGYSPAFRRAWEAHSDRPYPGEKRDAGDRWDAARIKARLFYETVENVALPLKRYAKARYGRSLDVVVAFHSPINYSQWKIVSPLRDLAQADFVDGIIAQAWTGTSRVASVYAGQYRSRPFEGAFLEYGALEAMCAGTGKPVWFLHDPVEDAPGYTWEDYEALYLKSVVASLLRSGVNRYEICPWPHRVFEGTYPRIQPNIDQKDETSVEVEASRPIPERYRTLVGRIFQVLRQMPEGGCGTQCGVGLLLSDTCLWQRSTPDTVEEDEAFLEDLYAQLFAGKDTRDMLSGIAADPARLEAFASSAAFPLFYALALPPVKRGLPLKMVTWDTLGDLQVLIASYAFMKPRGPEENEAIAAFVRAGGSLLLIIDEHDPYADMADSWWRKKGYPTAEAHLLSLLSLEAASGTYTCGAGRVQIMRICPALLSVSAEHTAVYMEALHALCALAGADWEESNHFTSVRGPYVISAVMEESGRAETQVLEGPFCDLLADDLPVIPKKTVSPGEVALLYRMDAVPEEACMIAGSAGVVSQSPTSLLLQAIPESQVVMRLRLPEKPLQMEGCDAEGNGIPLTCTWDAQSRTLLVRYRCPTPEAVLTWQYDMQKTLQ